MTPTQKQLIENKIRRIVKKVISEATDPELKDMQDKFATMSTDEIVPIINSHTNWKLNEILNLTLELLSDANYKTEVKYLGRLFADIERSGGIDNTRFYEAGIY